MSDQAVIITQFFLDPEVIFSSHTMFINTSTKEFTLVNNAIPSYDIAFEQLATYYTTSMPLPYCEVHKECMFSLHNIINIVILILIISRIEGCHEPL